MGKMEKSPVHNVSYLFLKKYWQKGLLRLKPGPYFNISQPSPKKLTPSFSCGSYRGVPCRDAALARGEWEGEKASSVQHPVSILNAVIRSTRSRRRCKEWKPRLCNPSSRGRWKMPDTNLVAYLWFHFKWFLSTTRFGKQAGIPCLRSARTHASYNGMKANFKRSWQRRIIMKINLLD